MMRRRPRRTEAAPDPVTGQAAVFFERKRFGDWTDSDEAELETWLSQSILHEVAYLRLAGHAARAERLGALRPFRHERWAWARALRLRWFAAPVLAAASAALLLEFGVPFVASLLEPPDRSIATEVGGRTLINFADHTQIELNTNSAIRYRMTTKERTVWLEKGEAWFHVAHDAAHPFTVVVGQHRVSDLGTEFVVRREPDSVDVALFSGQASLSAEGAQTAMLVPGDEAIATARTLTVSRRTPQQLDDAAAWRRGVLVFRNTPLSDVVKQYNRYNAVKLVIADPSVADEKITANTRTDDYESFLQMAQDVLRLRIEREGSVIRISRMHNKQASRTAHARRGD